MYWSVVVKPVCRWQAVFSWHTYKQLWTYFSETTQIKASVIGTVHCRYLNFIIKYFHSVKLDYITDFSIQKGEIPK